LLQLPSNLLTQLLILEHHPLILKTQLLILEHHPLILKTQLLILKSICTNPEERLH